MTIGVSASVFGVGVPLQYPLINGFSYSWASLEFKFLGSPIITVQSIDYAAKTERKQPYGTNPNPLSKTRGKLGNTAKVKMLAAEAYALIGALGALDPTGNNAYGDVFFNVTVSFSEAGQAVIVDTIVGCTVDTFEQSSAEGTDAIMIEMELNPLQILRNGQQASSAPLNAPQFP